MSIFETLIHLTIGGVFGFILGFITARLRDIRNELDGMVGPNRTLEDGTIKTPGTSEERKGFRWSFTNIAIVAVVFLTAWAAFGSQRANHDVNRTQDQVVTLSLCNQKFLSETITALNQRTTYASAQATSNVKLQKSQAAFFASLLVKPAASQATQLRAAQAYFDDLTAFVRVSEKAAGTLKSNPYPTQKELSACLASNPSKGVK